MRTTFLEEIADRLLAQYPGKMDNLQLVFPNRRAGLFFRKALAQRISKAQWAPRVYSLQDFIYKHEPFRFPDKLELVGLLHPIYEQVMGMKEPFEQFYYWGEMLLSDFEDIDSYMVDARQLFAVLKDQKEIDALFGEYEEEQRTLIARFWKNFDQRDAAQKLKFINNWKKLFPLYEAFREFLINEQKAYQGMFYRMVADRLRKGERQVMEGKMIFVGFNALTTAEEKIISWYIQEQGAEIYWDIDAYYMDNTYMEAGNFLRSYRQHPVFSDSFKKPYPQRILQEKKTIEYVAVADAVSQLKIVSEKLEKLSKNPNWKAEQTAVILADESLLMPLLHAIPPAVSKVNVTMGYPLRQSNFYAFVEDLVELHRLSREQKGSGELFFNHRPVLNILKHTSLYTTDTAKDSAELIVEITEKNMVWIKATFLNKNALLTSIFSKQTTVEFFQYVKFVFQTLRSELDELNLSLLVALYEKLNRLHDVLSSREEKLSWEGLRKLMRTFFNGVRIPFSGEPLKGLQIMGVLESRNLDFEHIFFLSVNEDVFPGQPSGHSYIPYNLRKAFSLPGIDQHDAIYSYLFYRLLQRAENLHFFYTTGNNNGKSSEMSHYLLQLQMESTLPISQFVLNNEPGIDQAQEISIAKTASVMERLRYRFLLSSENPYRLSPTAIYSYMLCRLQFYYSYVIGLRSVDDVQEDIDSRLFGNVLHDVMEHIYRPLVGGKLENSAFRKLRSQLDSALDSAFKKYFGVDEHDAYEFGGHHLLIRDLVKKVALRILEVDEKAQLERIVAVENKHDFLVDLPVTVDGRTEQIGLKGFIDRVDETPEAIRIIDYKTGRDDKALGSVEGLFERDKKINKAPFQTLFYGLQYLHNFNLPEGKVLQGGLYNLSELYKTDFHFSLTQGGKPIADISEHVAILEKQIVQLLEELFDPDQSFDQTLRIENCKYCDFKNMCGRP